MYCSKCITVSVGCVFFILKIQQNCHKDAKVNGNRGRTIIQTVKTAGYFQWLDGEKSSQAGTGTGRQVNSQVSVCRSFRKIKYKHKSRKLKPSIASRLN